MKWRGGGGRRVPVVDLVVVLEGFEVVFEGGGCQVDVAHPVGLVGVEGVDAVVEAILYVENLFGGGVSEGGVLGDQDGVLGWD